MFTQDQRQGNCNDEMELFREQCEHQVPRRMSIQCDGDTIATASGHGAMRIYNIRDGQLHGRLQGHKSAVWSFHYFKVNILNEGDLCVSKPRRPRQMCYADIKGPA